MDVTTGPDGHCIVVGYFTQFGGVPREGIARVLRPGTLDPSFTPAIDSSGYIMDALVQPDGKILIAGGFLSVNGTPRTALARLNPDGTLDAAFDPQVAYVPDEEVVVEVMALQPNGKILIGGSFSSVGGIARTYLARLNPDGTVDASFNSAVTGFYEGAPFTRVRRIDVHPDGSIVVAGDFIAIGGAPRPGLARLLSDGSLDPSFVPPTGAEHQWILVQPDRKVLVAQAGVPIKRLRTDGTVDPTFSTTIHGNKLVQESSGQIRVVGAILYSDGTLYYGSNSNATSWRQQDDLVATSGMYDDGSGNTRQALVLFRLQQYTVRLSAPTPERIEWVREGWTPEAARVSFELSLDEGTNWTPLGEGTRIPNGWEMTGLTLPASGMVRAQAWTSAGCVGTQTIHFPTFGHADTGFQLPPDYRPYAAAQQIDGNLIIGGAFSNVADVPLSGVARLLPDGTFDSTFASLPFTGTNPTVLSVAIEGSEKLLILGTFNTIGGVPRNGFCRLHRDGTLDASFSVPANGAIKVAVPLPDAKILIAGEFTEINGNAAPYIARLHPDGSLDSSFQASLNGSVRSAVISDGRTLIAGEFTHLGGVPRRYLARLHPNGALDESFAPGVVLKSPGYLYSLSAQADGKVVLGGYDLVANDDIMLVRLNADGTRDAAFDSNFNPGYTNSIYAFSASSLQADGKLLVSGLFYYLGGQQVTEVARVHPSGTVDDSFDPDAYSTAGYSEVQGVFLHADGKVGVHGGFNHVGAVPRERMARLINSPATQSLTVANPARIQWLRGGTAPEVEWVVFELSTNAGASWQSLGAGRRIPGGWEKRGISLPANGVVRARASVSAHGTYGASRGLVESTTTFTVSVDGDNDGLLDAWEINHFGATEDQGPADDFDQDGVVELIEMGLGLNPAGADAPGAMPPVSVDDGYLTITLTKQPGVTYLVQSAGSPESVAFSAATTTVLIDNATTLKVRDNVLEAPGGRRFLRIQITAAS